eukprot:m.180553 g.180553  ORF g.180553 m.180553 type:complete len:144 (+) comp18423_c0_seq4:245-676(+)
MHLSFLAPSGHASCGLGGVGVGDSIGCIVFFVETVGTCGSMPAGAIVTLTKLGPLVIDALLMDNLKTYHENTLGKSKASVDLQERTDARMVENALVNACNVYLKWDQEINKVPAATTPLPQPNVERRNKVMRELFGDKLSLLS